MNSEVSEARKLRGIARKRKAIEMKDEEAEKENRFQSLLALMLSSETEEQVTHDAMERLKLYGCTPMILLASPDEVLEKLIHPVCFYKLKVQYIKNACKILLRDYNGDIPDIIEGFCTLPGVGPQMAHSCMQVAWNKVTGIDNTKKPAPSPAPSKHIPAPKNLNPPARSPAPTKHIPASEMLNRPAPSPEPIKHIPAPKKLNPPALSQKTATSGKPPRPIGILAYGRLPSLEETWRPGQKQQHILVPLTIGNQAILVKIICEMDTETRGFVSGRLYNGGKKLIHKLISKMYDDGRWTGRKSKSTNPVSVPFMERLPKQLLVADCQVRFSIRVFGHEVLLRAIGQPGQAAWKLPAPDAERLHHCCEVVWLTGYKLGINEKLKK